MIDPVLDFLGDGFRVDFSRLGLELFGLADGGTVVCLGVDPVGQRRAGEQWRRARGGTEQHTQAQSRRPRREQHLRSDQHDGSFFHAGKRRR